MEDSRVNEAGNWPRTGCDDVVDGEGGTWRYWDDQPRGGVSAGRGQVPSHLTFSCWNLTATVSALEELHPGAGAVEADLAKGGKRAADWSGWGMSECSDRRPEGVLDALRVCDRHTAAVVAAHDA